jgi:predicted PurR-regulated permease PerM
MTHLATSVINKKNIFAIAFFVILIGLLVLLITLFGPFLVSFFWALILALVFYPFYQRIDQWLGRRANISAALVTILMMIIIVLPGFWMLTQLGQEIGHLYHTFSRMSLDQKKDWLQSKVNHLGILILMEKFGFDPVHAESLINQTITSSIQKLSQLALNKLAFVFKHIALFAMDGLFVIVAVFFFLRDGEKYSRKIIDFLPIEPDHREKVVKTFTQTVVTVVRALVVTNLIHGILAGAGFAIVGAPVPVLLGVSVFFSSFVPFLSVFMIWIPTILWVLNQGHIGAAILLSLWGIIVVNLSDNLVKTWMIGNDSQLPFFLIFFTIIGGLKVYGVLGIFLGPIILSLGLAFFSIYREVYLEDHQKNLK